LRVTPDSHYSPPSFPTSELLSSTVFCLLTCPAFQVLFFFSPLRLTPRLSHPSSFLLFSNTFSLELSVGSVLFSSRQSFFLLTFTVLGSTASPFTFLQCSVSSRIHRRSFPFFFQKFPRQEFQVFPQLLSVHPSYRYHSFRYFMS